MKDNEQLAREWLEREFGPGMTNAANASSLANKFIEIDRAGRRAAFMLFNDYMNEFTENMRADPRLARETMKRRMLEMLS